MKWAMGVDYGSNRSFRDVFFFQSDSRETLMKVFFLRGRGDSES